VEAIKPNTPPKPTGCAPYLKGCLIVVAVLIVAFLGLLIYVLQMKPVRDLAQCKVNMETIGEALRRYNDVNGEYPTDLKPIAKDYLKDDSVLYCPLSTNRRRETSYTYHRPGASAKDDFVVLECARHKLRPDVPASKILLLRSGGVIAESPSFREFMRENEKRSKKKGTR